MAGRLLKEARVDVEKDPEELVKAKLKFRQRQLWGKSTKTAPSREPENTGGVVEAGKSFLGKFLGMGEAARGIAERVKEAGEAAKNVEGRGAEPSGATGRRAKEMIQGGKKRRKQ
jgi:hypothetical protein